MSQILHCKWDFAENVTEGLRPTSSTEVNIAKLKEMVTENRHLSLGEIAVELSVSYGSIRTILNDCLGMKRVAARLVPKDHLTRIPLQTNFWPETQRILSNNHRIRLIWLRPTFFSFKNSNYSRTSFIGTPLKCKHLVYRDLEGLPTKTYSLMAGCHDSCCMLTFSNGYVQCKKCTCT